MRRIIYMSDFSESYSYNLLRGIVAYTLEHTPWTICRMPRHFKTEFGLEGVLKWAQQWKADAVIGQFDPTDRVEIFSRHGLLCVAQDTASLFDSIPNITSDYRHTGRLGAQFFMERNFRNFAFCGLSDQVWSTGRRDGFLEYLQQHGLAHRCQCFEEPSSGNMWLNDGDRSRLLQWLRQLPHSTALMTCDDNMGNHVLDLCRVHGIAVPHRIAVLGVDNDEIIANLSDPPLSSISLDLRKAGYQVAEMIDQTLDSGGEISPYNIYVETQQVVNRLSTEYIAYDDPQVQAAIKFLHTNMALNISVDDVVRQVPMSRRLLEIRFKRVTGQTIHSYLFAMRMNRLAQLLTHSRQPIAELAAQVGLFNIKNLSRQFKSTFGMSPGEYRRRSRLEFGE